MAVGSPSTSNKNLEPLWYWIKRCNFTALTIQVNKKESGVPKLLLVVQSHIVYTSIILQVAPNGTQEEGLASGAVQHIRNLDVSGQERVSLKERLTEFAQELSPSHPLHQALEYDSIR